MWVNHKWLWVWAVVVKVEGGCGGRGVWGGGGGVWPHIPKMFAGVLSLFCRLLSKMQSTKKHLFCSSPKIFVLMLYHPIMLQPNQCILLLCQWVLAAVKAEGRERLF